MYKNLALINLYFGELPVWFPAFLQSCKYNPSINWLLFTDCADPKITTDNVKFIPFSILEFNTLASNKLGFDVQLTRPYKLCDFRPAFGIIFNNYLKNYDFWGHCDVDIIWGDIRQFITNNILNEYEIISGRKGKTCGHFTLYKNVNKVNTLYRKHSDYQTIMQSPKSFIFDETGMTTIIREIIKHGEIKVYWSRFLLNFANHTNDIPSILRKHKNRWYWEKGKLYERNQQTGELKEIMYLHFMTWKKSLRACNFQYLDEPKSFYISYSHIGLTLMDPPPLCSSVLWNIQWLRKNTRRILHNIKVRLRQMIEKRC